MSAIVGDAASEQPDRHCGTDKATVLFSFRSSNTNIGRQLAISVNEKSSIRRFFCDSCVISRFMPAFTAADSTPISR